MPRLHLITAHRQINRSDEPVVIYCGHDADQALKLRDKVLATGEFAVMDKWTVAERSSRYASEAQRTQKKQEAPAPEPAEKPQRAAHRRR